ncbi:MAG: hypothetical protein PVI83_05965 [Lysobacterales bacterium]
MRKELRDRLPYFLFLLGIALSLLLTASCTSQLITGRAPFVGVSLMELDEPDLTVRFDLSNENGVAMNIETMNIRIMVRDNVLLEHSSQEKLPIDANSAESVTVESKPGDFTRTLLASLSDGTLDSLSITISGSVDTLDEGRLQFDEEGYLYRVPGRPGQFRAAVTRTEKLVRDDPR